MDNLKITTPSLRRVLLALDLDPSQKFGSLEEQVFRLALRFRERGGFLLPVYDAPQSPSSAELYRLAGLKVEALSMRKFRFSTFKQLVRLIRRERIQVVNWNFYEPLLNPYLWWLSILMPRLRHEFTDHISRIGLKPPNASIGLRSRVKRLLQRRYSKILVISDYLLGYYPQGSTVARWHLFVNTDRFQPDSEMRQEVRKHWGELDSFVVLVVAYLRPEKGVDLAIRALSKLPEDCVLWIVGGGGEKDRLQSLSQELGLGSRVLFLGNQTDVSEFVKAADCLACPSTWAEALGLVNLEAMASGLPVVASQVGGIPEFIIDGENGILIPPGDIDALTDALRKLRDDPDLRREMGRRSRELAVRDHSTARRLDEAVDLYLS